MIQLALKFVKSSLSKQSHLIHMTAHTMLWLLMFLFSNNALAVTTPQVAGGGSHSCALTSGGGVKCWGDNTNGQLGNNTTSSQLTPVYVNGLSAGVTAIATGQYHSCALTSGGGVMCWGKNTNGQLGDNTTNQRLFPVFVNGLITGVIAIATGANHSCALTTGGGVKCWGLNTNGQLGNNTTNQQLIPVDVNGLTAGVSVIATGNAHSCALTTGGGVKCWGNNGSGQLGDGTTTQRLTPVNVNGLSTGVSAIAPANTHSCALTGGGVKCWGDNTNGQLGNNTTTQQLTPVDVNGLTTGVIAIDTGTSHSCALNTGGGVKCWGLNTNGQVGDGTLTQRLIPVDATSLTSGVTAFTTGDFHSCALTSGGGVKCWGSNSTGQLGNNTTNPQLDPFDVNGLNTGVSAIATGSGSTHSCALTTSGGVKCWGDNTYGQLGNNTTISQLTPVDVNGLTSGVAIIAPGQYHSCALTTSGGVKCWGLNANGQLGNNTTTDQLTPVDVTGLTSGVSAIATGAKHSCALTTGGGVKCWGFNPDGRLGDNTTTQRPTPVNVTGLTSGVTAIATGTVYSCALTTGGGVKCWGNNGSGRLGDGTTTNRLTPVDVSGLTSGVAGIAPANSHSCALTTGGGVKCWGDNTNGQLGDNTTTQRLTQVNVSGLTTGVIAIHTGETHSCALTTGGGVKCWGLNTSGQLGDNTIIQKLTPVDVNGLTTGVTEIATGQSHSCALTTSGGIKCWGSNSVGQTGIDPKSPVINADGSQLNLFGGQVLSVSNPGTGVITSDTGGINCGSSCSASYAYNGSVTLTTTANTGYIFSTWTGDCVSNLTNSCLLTMNAAKTVGATFLSTTKTLTVSRTGTGIGDVKSASLEIDCGATCSYAFNNNANSILTAYPDIYSIFTGWSGGGCSGTGTCSVTMDVAKTVTATFSPKHYINVAQAANGTITSNPAGISCGASCSSAYLEGTSVTLTASANSNYAFSSWTGACAGNVSNSCTLSLNADKSVSAVFIEINKSLTVSKTGTGTGNVKSGGLEIDCGTACSYRFNNNTSVTLTATPDVSSTFTGWSGGGCTGTGSCSVTMDVAKSVTAAFTLNTYALTTAKAGNSTGTGTITSSTGGISCGSTCSASIAYGTAVTLTATPDAGTSFSGWGGACSGQGTCSLTITAATTVTASFISGYSLTVTSPVNGTIGGRSIICGVTGTNCNAFFAPGTPVRYIAEPASGYSFGSWGGACAGVSTYNSCSLSMDAAKSVTATFVPIPPPVYYDLTIIKPWGRDAWVKGQNIDCGTTCSAKYLKGTEVKLSLSFDPLAYSKVEFSGGSCSDIFLGKSCTVTMDAAKSVTATFIPVKYYGLGITITGRGTVWSWSPNFNCNESDGRCGKSFIEGSSVMIYAKPADGYSFTGWSGGDCSGTAGCGLTFNAGKSVTANFAPIPPPPPPVYYGLTITNTGGGTVNGQGLLCGTSCSANYLSGKQVPLKAAPNNGYDFTGWSGGGCSGTTSCTVTMDAAKTVTATFASMAIDRTLTVTTTGNGYVTGVGINCGTTCMKNYPATSTYPLMATAAPGSVFSGWGGACSGTATTCSVTTDGVKSVTATFSP